MSGTTTTSFHYTYVTTREEFVEGVLEVLRDEIGRKSKWRPNIVLLLAMGIGGAFASTTAQTAYGKTICILAPIPFAVLLMVTSKETRMATARQQIEINLSRRYDEKKCHSHEVRVDEAGLVERCPCGTDTRTWGSLKRWHETERLIILETLSRACYAIPKRVIPISELQPLRDLISQHVQKDVKGSGS